MLQNLLSVVLFLIPPVGTALLYALTWRWSSHHSQDKGFRRDSQQQLLAALHKGAFLSTIICVVEAILFVGWTLATVGIEGSLSQFVLPVAALTVAVMSSLLAFILTGMLARAEYDDGTFTKYSHVSLLVLTWANVAAVLLLHLAAWLTAVAYLLAFILVWVGGAAVVITLGWFLIHACWEEYIEIRDGQRRKRKKVPILNIRGIRLYLGDALYELSAYKQDLLLLAFRANGEHMIKPATLDAGLDAGLDAVRGAVSITVFGVDATGPYIQCLRGGHTYMGDTVNPDVNPGDATRRYLPENLEMGFELSFKAVCTTAVVRKKSETILSGRLSQPVYFWSVEIR